MTQVLNIQRWLILTILCTGLAVGCGESNESIETHDITLCDGSNDVRLAYRVEAGSARLPAAEQVMLENGLDYLYVDGQCRYWALPSASGETNRVWTDLVTGQLTGEQEDKLISDLHLGQWHQWNERTFVQSDLDDGSTQTFWMPEAAFQCVGDCGSDLRRTVHDATRSWLRRLATDGAPVDNRLRAVVVRLPPMAEPDDFSPLSIESIPTDFDLVAHALSVHEASRLCFGAGFMIPDQAAPRLREIRDAYVTGDHGYFVTAFLPLKDESGQLYKLYFRETIPLENDDGLVELDGVPQLGCYQ